MARKARQRISYGRFFLCLRTVPRHCAIGTVLCALVVVLVRWQVVGRFVYLS